MAHSARKRKLQDPVLLDALAKALAAGKPLDSALADVGVHRSTLKREMERDAGVRRRVEQALLSGWVAPGLTARNAQSAPPAADRPVQVAGPLRASEAVPWFPRKVSEAAGRTAEGTGRIVFRSGRPHPLTTVRRMAFRSVAPRVVDRSTSREDHLAVHDWMPAFLVLVANVAIAVATAGSFLLIGVIVLVTASYGAAVHWSWRTRLAHSPAREAADLTASAVRRDLKWLAGTIGQTRADQRPGPSSRERPRG